MSAGNLAGATAEEVASFLLLTEFARRLYRDDSDARCMSKGPLACLHECLPDAEIALITATLRELFTKLSDQSQLDEALRLVLQLHRAEVSRESVMSALPLWEFATLLVDRGADARRLAYIGLIDRHALVERLRIDEAGAAPPSSQGLGFRRGHDIVLLDNALLVSPDRPLALRDFGEWKARQGVGSQPIVPGARPRMHPGELDNFLEDVRRIARPLEDCQEATVRLDIPHLWAKASRRQLATVLDDLRSGQLPVWVRAGRAGLSRFYVGSRAVKRFERLARRSDARQYAHQLQLAL